MNSRKNQVKENQMRQYKKYYELKNAAKNSLDGKYGEAMLVCFLNWGIPLAASFVLSFIYSITVFLYAGVNPVTNFTLDVFTLLLTIFFGILHGGQTYYFLNVACHQPRSVSNLFYGFRADYKKILLVSGASILCNALYLQPQQYLVERYLATMESGWQLAALLFTALGLCLYLPISLGIQLALYVMLDFPQYPARETLALCWRMMRGHKRRLLWLQCSFLPMMLLCVFTLFIGFLWLIPYMNMTFTYFYLDLMQQTSPSHKQ